VDSPRTAVTTHLIPLDLIKLLDHLLSILALSEEIVQVRTPFLSRDDLARELLDVGFNVRSEDVEPADLSFNVEEEVASPLRLSATGQAEVTSTYLSYGTVLNPRGNGSAENRQCRQPDLPSSGSAYRS
jgi:hypothetical protein